MPGKLWLTDVLALRYVQPAVADEACDAHHAGVARGQKRGKSAANSAIENGMPDA